MTERILLTGATGFLGTELAARLIRDGQVKIYALVRAGSDAGAHHRLRAVWHHDKNLCAAVGTQVIPVCGDFAEPCLGVDPETEKKLLEDVTLIIHAGAQVGFQESKEDLMRANYEGTRHMVEFAERAAHLRRFVFISTAYVAGRNAGTIWEEDPPAEAFSTYYEESKALAENLVRNSSLPFTVCRPGMIVGDSRTGWVRSFNTVYYVLKLMLLEQLPVLPVKRETRVNIVPGDYVAESVIRICASEEAEGKTFHLTCPKEAAPRADELAEYVGEWADRNLGLSLFRPVFAPAPALKGAGLVYNKKEKDRKKGLLTNLLTLLPYFFDDQSFDRTNTESVCGDAVPQWRGYMDKLLAFACRVNFMNQTGRTVFEQACVRRESTRFPVCYYDVAEDGIRRMSGPQANRRIRRIEAALRAWGVRKGDRIALTGINSIAYMLLEQAIGLTGAVSVPIYYTTPPAEVSLLLTRSGAKWFFIGDTRIMEHAGELQTEAQMVSFSAGQAIRNEKVMRWAQFMKKAQEYTEQPTEQEDVQNLPPDPDDLATIRFTSGTTGEPKGVMFSFGQLAWMGEVLTNLLTWEDRNSTMRYLSFLPLSHVVEGILASYAPYYVLARVDYFYLNDFGSLTQALPKVRPNVFFSVPRFYEKVWDQLSSNRLGKVWLSEKDGPARKALGAVLRRAILKKAGLDNCRQLIVGSAPVSETLLMQYRALGIEIHNAYGQTEAPLITINRLGDNVIPTIGTPLPDTEVTVEPDGELIVKGPQVALGYYGLATDTIRDGVLRTGDLGTVHENGHITLFGRKKDMIITSYGKNISRSKIEERLKDITGISEAVLIGENRPYCTALLWPEEDADQAELSGRLQEEITRMNAGLSHPEQVRRYRVISQPLSIAAGELTPNLKTKRAVIEEHYAREVDELYNGITV